MKKHLILFLFAAAALVTFTLQSCCQGIENEDEITHSDLAVIGYVTCNLGNRLPGATVELTVNGLTFTTIADSVGYFEFRDLPICHSVDIKAYMTGSEASLYSTSRETIDIIADNETYYSYPNLSKAITDGQHEILHDEVVEEGVKVDRLIEGSPLPNCLQDSTSGTNADYAYAMVYDTQTTLEGAGLEMATNMVIEPVEEIVDTLLEEPKALGDKKTLRIVLSSTIRRSDGAAKTGRKYWVAFNVQLKPDYMYYLGKKVDVNSMQEFHQGGIDGFAFQTDQFGTTQLVYYVNATQIANDTNTPLKMSTNYVEGPSVSKYIKYDYTYGWSKAGGTSNFIEALVRPYCGYYKQYDRTGYYFLNSVSKGYAVSLEGNQWYKTWQFYLRRDPSQYANVLNTSYNIVTATTKDVRDHTGGSN